MNDAGDDQITGSVESCPACAALKCEPAGTKNDCKLYQCRDCGTLYSERCRLNYDQYYDGDNLSVPDSVNRWLDELFAALNASRQNNRLLDVGCGAGSLLQAARRAGWEAEGLEISEPAAEHVRALGFEVFCGDLSSAHFPDEHFDVVMASELVEHLAKPLDFLKEAARILRPGGLLWATTPNGRGISARLLGTRWSMVSPPEHLQLFTIEGIRRLTRRAGFGHARISSRSCNPLEIWYAIRRGHRTIHPNGSVTSHSDRHAVVPAAVPADNFDRVRSSYQLNELMLRNPLTRGVKIAANATLRATGLGDTIRIEALNDFAGGNEY